MLPSGEVMLKPEIENDSGLQSTGVTQKLP
jgi:hypothetical protein